MNNKCAIIGTDERFLYLEQVLSRDKEVKLFASTVWDEGLKLAINQFKPNIIFLPIQALKMETVFELPPSCQVLFIGKKNVDIEQVIKEKKCFISYYLEDEQWIWDNANLTAEGFINYFYTHEKKALYNKKFVITGYGRVGKRLAFALQNLGAEVVISVRSEHQLYEAKSYGFQIELLENMLEKQSDETTYLINTIPFKWLHPLDSNSFSKIFDLASHPGCLLDSDEQRPSNYVLSTSLPGMYFPQDAGYLIAQAVETYLLKVEEEKTC